MIGVAVRLAVLIWAESCGAGKADTGGAYQLTAGGPTPVRISAHGYQQYDFTLLRPGCAIAGNISVIAGGDFDAAVLDNGGFRRWRQHREFRALWRADRVSTTTIAARSGDPGLYHLVVSSTFATLTSKTVTVTVHANIECL